LCFPRSVLVRGEGGAVSQPCPSGVDDCRAVRAGHPAVGSVRNRRRLTAVSQPEPPEVERLRFVSCRFGRDLADSPARRSPSGALTTAAGGFRCWRSVLAGSGIFQTRPRRRGVRCGGWGRRRLAGRRRAGVARVRPPVWGSGSGWGRRGAGCGAGWRMVSLRGVRSLRSSVWWEHHDGANIVVDGEQTCQLMVKVGDRITGRGRPRR
jgi:hypothetical protein